MGDRGNIVLKYSMGEPIYLYTHWHGSELPGLLADALDSTAGRNRWADESYLARIIFSRMVWHAEDQEQRYLASLDPEARAKHAPFLGEGLLGETGFGIAPYMVDSDGTDLYVDLAGQTVNGVGYLDYILEVKGVDA